MKPTNCHREVADLSTGRIEMTLKELKLFRSQLDALIEAKTFSSLRDCRALDVRIGDYHIVHWKQLEGLSKQPPAPKPLSLEQVEKQLKWANDQLVNAQENGDKKSEEAWHGYGQALQWVISHLKSDIPAIRNIKEPLRFKSLDDYQKFLETGKKKYSLKPGTKAWELAYYEESYVASPNGWSYKEIVSAARN